MKRAYVPIVQGHDTKTGAPMDLAVLAGAMADDLGEVGPLGLTIARYAARGGVVKFNYKPVGTLDLVDAKTFLLKTNSANAKHLLDTGVVCMLAVELDARGEVLETWLADKAAAVSKMSDALFQKMQQRPEVEKQMTSSEQLESALKKCLANPGVLRKDAIDLNPPAKTPSRTPTVPNGTINVAELARANDEIRVIGDHLQAAMRENPGSRQISDAGMSWYAITTLGLGIDSAFMGGAQTVAVTPDNSALAEAWAHSTADKAAGGFLDFRKALTITRAAPNVFTRNGGRITSRPFFSKAAEADDGQDEAHQVLRESAIHTARAHLKALSDKLDLAQQAHPGSPHLREARVALDRAQQHLENCGELDSGK